MTRRTQGFTLLEMLVVIAILGLLATLGFGAYDGLAQRSEVRSAADTLAFNLNKARTSAKRDHTRWTLEVMGARSYRVGPAGGTLTTVTLPRKTNFDSSTVSARTSVNFDPPWGARTEYQAGGSDVPTFTLESVGRTRASRTVKVISLLGEVSVQ